jgi:hypothetical protein
VVVSAGCHRFTSNGVVTANDGGRIDLSTVVYDQQQELITVGSATAGIVR